MKIEFQRYLSSLCTIAVLITAPLAGHAMPTTYDIGAGSAPGFTASYLHAGTTQMGSTGYYANGAKIGVTGSLTIDMADLAGTYGEITGSGDFGQGVDDWTIFFTGASAGLIDLYDNGVTTVKDLITLDYVLLDSSDDILSEGSFYFANRDFNGGSISDGPNYIDSSVLYLWGNNWINISGGSDNRDNFVDAGGLPLGLDLYGVAYTDTVPEPGIAALLAIGLVGFGFKRRLKSA